MADAKRPFDTELDVVRSVNSAKKNSKTRGKGFGGVRVSDNLAEVGGMIAIKDSAPESESETVDETPIETEEKPVEETPKDAAPAVDVHKLVQDAIASTVAPLQQQLSQSLEQIQSLKSELEKKDSELAQAQDSAKVLAELSKLAGSSKLATVNVNTKTTTKESPKGLVNELSSLLESNKQTVRDINTNMVAVHRDPRPIARFIQSSLREDKAKGREWRNGELVQSIESYFKQHGYLQGRIVDAAGATTGTTAPPFFLDILSSLMRETHSQTNVFWQFPMTVYDPGTAPGRTVLIPRFANLGEPTSVADFLIASTTAYNSIGLTVGTNSDSQSLDATSVPVGINQYGLGRATAIATRPVYIPEFYEATSLLSLIDAVDQRLMQNYYRFEDLLIRAEFLKATTIAYNDRGNVTSAPLDVAAGDIGTLTRDFLNAVYSQMFAAQIPAMPDGCYALVTNPTAANQLKVSLDTLYAAPSPEQVASATNTFRMATGVEIGELAGYMGNFCNFHVFVTNSIGVGAVDSVTVHTTTFAAGVGAQTTADSFAFGMGAVGRGVAQAVEMRTQAAPFGLGDAYIWTSREGVSALDVDASSVAPANQQTRVWRLRTTRVAV